VSPCGCLVVEIVRVPEWALAFCACYLRRNQIENARTKLPARAEQSVLDRTSADCALPVSQNFDNPDGALVATPDHLVRRNYIQSLFPVLRDVFQPVPPPADAWISLTTVLTKGTLVKEAVALGQRQVLKQEDSGFIHVQAKCIRIAFALLSPTD